MGTINSLPGPHPLSQGSDRSGPSYAGTNGTLRQKAVRLLVTILDLLVRWQKSREDQIALRTMDERLLRDIGLDQAQAHSIADRIAKDPFKQHQ